MSNIQRYQINIPQEQLDLLQKKLSLTNLPDDLEDSTWDYGVPLSEIKRLLSHWQNKYNWREHEQRMNASLPQFTADVTIPDFGTLNIHFIHQQSSVTNAIPLLFCHGWPGHFLEVSKILPKLVQGGSDAPAFHVVAPSLPNYGFSDGVKRKGFGLAKYAEVCHKLMLALGYPQYATQGGDWGYAITRIMGLKYPSACRASHLNMYPNIPNYKNPLLAAEFYAQYLVFGLGAHAKEAIDRSKWFLKEGRGYFLEQASKPQTIGYAQADSPVGLLAWIYEKLHDWTDGYPWTDDEILTWVSVYVFSRAGPAAASRIYYEAAHEHGKGVRGLAGEYNGKTLLGVSRFPKDIMPAPTKWGATLGPLVFEGSHERGGHFAAWECPDDIVGDLRKMFGKGGGAYGAVEGKGGYESAARL